MRKHYLDNIRWGTVVIVVLYHVLYMYNAEGVLGGLGKITKLNVPVIAVYRLGFYLFAFLLGYFVLSHEEVMAVVMQWFLFFLVLALVTGVAFCAKYFGQNYGDAPVNRSALFTSYGWFASLAILGGTARYADDSNRFTE